MKPILILKTGNTIPSLLRTGVDFEDWIAAGCQLKPQDLIVVAVFEDQPLPELSSVAGVIVTGSPAYVTDKEAWSERSAAFLCSAVHRKIPVLGICYGHQLLAHALNGVIGFHPGGREIGTAEIELTGQIHNDRLFSGFPKIFKGQVSHQQTVLELPTGAVRLASNDFEPNHAFRIGDTAWGVQFHPEFSAATTAAYINERRDQLINEGLDPDSLQQKIEETPTSASLLLRFRQLAEAL